MSGNLPWGINTIGSLYHPDAQAGLPDGRWVAAVCEPCPPSIRERFRAAWWVFTGRAHAFVWPMAGDLEAIWTRDNPTLRPTPRPFVPQETWHRELIDREPSHGQYSNPRS